MKRQKYRFRQIISGDSLPNESGTPLSIFEIDEEIPRAELMSFNQIATRLRISRETLRRRLRDGSFPASTIYSMNGKQHFWARATVLGWIEINKSKNKGKNIKDIVISADLSKELDDVLENRTRDEREKDDQYLKMKYEFRNDIEKFIKDHPLLKDWALSRIKNQI